MYGIRKRQQFGAILRSHRLPPLAAFITFSDTFSPSHHNYVVLVYREREVDKGGKKKRFSFHYYYRRRRSTNVSLSLFSVCTSSSSETSSVSSAKP
jgi:hypothetical protein